MPLIKILVIMCLAQSSLFAQTLFQDNAPSLNNAKPSVSKQSAIVTAIASKEVKDLMPNQYSIFTNLESLILRGDVQLYYETFRQKQWSMVLSAHINPQSTHNDVTGDYGVAVGGRYYFDGYFDDMPIYLQSLAGFNQYDHWEFDVVIEAGQRININRDFFIDTGFVVHRSYYDRMEDPNVYLKITVGMHASKPLIPFF